jgi:hypothetical protein
MFTKLAQLNLNHYDNHPGRHKVLLLGYAVMLIVVVPKMLKKIAGADTTP